MTRLNAIKILLIHDNKHGARLLKDLLHDNPEHTKRYRVKHLNYLTEAITHLSKRKFDVIICRAGLPESGEEGTFNLLRDFASHLPLIFIADTGEDLAMRALQSGAQDYLIKGELNRALLERSIAFAIERKRLERNSMQAKEHLRAVTDNAASCFFMLDRRGVPTFMNPAALEITGFTFEELKTDTLHNTLHHHHPDGRRYAARDCPLSQAFGNPKTVRGEEIFIRKDGTFFPITYSMSPLVREKDFSGAVLEFQDVTDRKQLERQKDDFIGIASHELKTPVTSAKAYAQVLSRRFKRAGDLTSAELIDKMDTQLNKLNYLISDLLDITKIESGKLQMQRESFDFNELVEEVVEEMRQTSEHHTILLDLAMSRQVYGDRYRISQVLTNLITNAIKYSPHADKINLKSVTSDKYITLSVRDYGLGIPRARRKQVFERFYRVTGPHQETYPGLGLGLYISAEIIKRHRGRIWVESEAGEGSTFYFKLPAKPAEYL